MCGALLHVWALAGWLKLCFFGWPLALFGPALAWPPICFAFAPRGQATRRFAPALLSIISLHNILFISLRSYHIYCLAHSASLRLFALLIVVHSLRSLYSALRAAHILRMLAFVAMLLRIRCAHLNWSFAMLTLLSLRLLLIAALCILLRSLSRCAHLFAPCLTLVPSLRSVTLVGYERAPAIARVMNVAKLHHVCVWSFAPNMCDLMWGAKLPKDVKNIPL
jgi:hypothetical protein